MDCTFACRYSLLKLLMLGKFRVFLIALPLYSPVKMLIQFHLHVQLFCLLPTTTKTPSSTITTTTKNVYYAHKKRRFPRNRIRGRLASLLMLSVCTGILIGFVTVPYVSYYVVPKIFAPLPILFFIAFVLFPETPHHFIARQKFEVSKNIRQKKTTEVR